MKTIDLLDRPTFYLWKVVFLFSFIKFNFKTLLNHIPNADRMGEYYRHVPANTLNGDLLFAMKLCKSFKFDEYQSLRRFRSTHAENVVSVMTDLSPSDCHPLSSFVDALEDATAALLSDSRCMAIKGNALRMNKSFQSNHHEKWETTVRFQAGHLQTVYSDALVYSCGGKPIEISLQPPPSLSSSSPPLPPPPVSVLSTASAEKEPTLPVYYSMDKMVDPQYCINLIAQDLTKSDSVWAVIGGSHSAMLVVKNLVEAGAKNIVNIYRSDLRFMHATEEGWLRLALILLVKLSLTIFFVLFILLYCMII